MSGSPQSRQTVYQKETYGASGPSASYADLPRSGFRQAIFVVFGTIANFAAHEVLRDAVSRILC